MQKIRFLICRLAKRILFYIIVLIMWEAIYRISVEYLHIWKSYFFSSPSKVLITMIDMIKDDNVLIIAILTSLRRVFIGFLIAAAIGLILGFIVARFKYIEENVSHLLLGIQALPNVCWIPFAILWYGLGENSIIFVVVAGSAFSVAIAVEAGIKNISPSYIKVAKSMGAKGLILYKDIIFPAALPNFISGLKQGWSFAWRALMAGEMLSASIGLGQLLMMSREIFDMSRVIAIMLIIILIGLAVDKLVFGRIEAKVRYRWGLR